MHFCIRDKYLLTLKPHYIVVPATVSYIYIEMTRMSKINIL